MPIAPRPLPSPFDDEPFSTRAAEEEGISASRLRARDLVAPFAGVRSLHPPTTVPQLVRAYLPIMVPGEFFTHSTAAQLHGMWLPLDREHERLVHVSVRKPQRAPRNAGVAGHHLVDRPGLVRDLAGVPTANPVDTWCQLGTMLSLEDLVAAGDSLVAKDRPEPGAMLERLAAAAADEHRPYHAVLAKAIGSVRIGSRSRGESRWRYRLLRRGVPEPEVNGRIVDADGRFVAEGDLVWRHQKVLGEYEGDGHREQRQFRKDIRRYEELQDLGWRVVRATADDVERTPDESAARLRRLLVERAR